MLKQFVNVSERVHFLHLLETASLSVLRRKTGEAPTQVKGKDFPSTGLGGP
jgi:hypothetical protein